MRYAKVFLMGAVFCAVAGCKKPDVTESPSKLGASSEPDGPVVLVTGADEISLESIPKLTVSLDIKDCVGDSKWLHRSETLGLRSGAVSVVPRLKESDGMAQPDAKLFEPKLPKDPEDSTKEASYEFSWRIKRTNYAIEIIAYNVKTTTVESRLEKDFDFASGNEVNLKAEGTWQQDSCKLAWKE